MARSSRSPRSSPKPLWLIVLLAVAGWAYNTFFKSPSNQTTTTQREPRPRATSSGRRAPTPRKPSTTTVEGGQTFSDTVVKVSDGDTIKLANHNESVRLIGVDCPEKAQQGGAEATEFAASALLNQRVEIELCPKQPTDRYGRYLGFVWFNRGGRRVLFNAELVRQGYARVYSLRPCTVDETEWNGYYEEARQARRGLFRTMNDVPDAASYRRQKKSGGSNSS